MLTDTLQQMKQFLEFALQNSCFCLIGGGGFYIGRQTAVNQGEDFYVAQFLFWAHLPTWSPAKATIHIGQLYYCTYQAMIKESELFLCLVTSYRVFLWLWLLSPLKAPITEKLIQARLGVSRTIYVNADLPNLGFQYFLGGISEKKPPFT